MSVDLNVGFFWYEVGNGSFLHSFFSTIAYNLESGEWGSRYPTLMNELYQGKLESARAGDAMEELRRIEQELKKYPPNRVVWDIDDLSKQPPWGNEISSEVTDLSNYFFTSDGKNLIAVLMEALEKAQELGQPVEIM